jgi:CheY-like chemotaxis protein
MSDIAIIESDLDLGKAYAEALEATGHAAKVIGSDVEAMDYLVRQRKAPDVVVLDMRRPGGAEMVVMGAVYRLSHLAQTKVLAITQESGGGQRAGQSWGADLFLSAPFSAAEFRRAIHTLTAGLGSDAPAGGKAPVNLTRVWWEGEEAVFIRWTDQSLVLAWPDATDTAVKIPRGAVTRLMGKGVLQVEGNVPTWVRLSHPEPTESRPVHPSAESHEAALSARPASDDEKVHSRNQHQAAVMAAPQAAGDRLDAPANKSSVVARLIRKLTGGGESQRQQGSSRALQGS